MKLILGILFIILGFYLLIHQVKTFELEYNKLKLVAAGVGFIIVGIALIYDWSS